MKLSGVRLRPNVVECFSEALPLLLAREAALARHDQTWMHVDVQEHGAPLNDARAQMLIDQQLHVCALACASAWVL